MVMDGKGRIDFILGKRPRRKKKPKRLQGVTGSLEPTLPSLSSTIIVPIAVGNFC